MRTGRLKQLLKLSTEEWTRLKLPARRPKTAQAATVCKWRRRYVGNRTEGLLDEPRPGAPRRISDESGSGRAAECGSWTHPLRRAGDSIRECLVIRFLDMGTRLSRRNLLMAAAAGSAAAVGQRPVRGPAAPSNPSIEPYAGRSTVSLISGGKRYDNVLSALTVIEDQILPVLASKRSVLIKPNVVDYNYPLAVTHPDALRAVLDFIVAHFRGPIVIGEGSALDTPTGYATLGYTELIRDYSSRDVRLVCFHDEGLYKVMYVTDQDTHITPVRLAARLFDPTAFVISLAMLKTHNVVVATMTVKNMVMGAPLHQGGTDQPAWSDKRKFHAGVRVSNYDMFLNAQKQRPYWNLGVIDGFEGMEGNGPTGGTMVPSHVALASTDLIALDRVGLDVMGIDPAMDTLGTDPSKVGLGYLTYCWQAGLGQFDMSLIDVRGGAIGPFPYAYKLHSDIAQELLWMGPATDCGSNPILG